jgi:hypothetical protein
LILLLFLIVRLYGPVRGPNACAKAKEGSP